jgi:multidrug efflux pump subunit AcrA (membrane-fusion protein)
MCSFCQKGDSRANPAGSHANTSHPVGLTAWRPTTEHKPIRLATPNSYPRNHIVALASFAIVFANVVLAAASFPYRLVTNTANINLLAPSDGLLLARNVSNGQKFDKGTELFRIANLARVWVLADSFAKDAGDLTPGRTARVSIAGTACTVAARISEVPPQFDPNSQTLNIRLEVDNPGYALRADMFVESSTGGARL